jgi:HlyD family secretion protein
VSFGSTKTDNVVTYITWLEVDNSDLSLRPGMTAAATITSTERNDVLLVPNTALRFTPAVAAAAASRPLRAAASCRSSCRACHAPTRRAAGAGPQATGGPPCARSGCCRTAWPQAVNVQVGISDGRMTEVSGEGLSRKKAWP